MSRRNRGRIAAPNEGRPSGVNPFNEIPSMPTGSVPVTEGEGGPVIGEIASLSKDAEGVLTVEPIVPPDERGLTPPLPVPVVWVAFECAVCDGDGGPPGEPCYRCKGAGAYRRSLYDLPILPDPRHLRALVEKEKAPPEKTPP